ncbi:MAG: hypothetical protein ACREC9_00140 [Methylocella sp.]
MKRFGVLVASAALGAALASSGPALAFGSHGGGGFGGGGFHGGGGFGGGGFHGGGGFGGGHMGGFGGSHFGGGGFGGFGGGGFRGIHGPMFAGRSMAIGGFNRGSGFNHGFDHRFARFDHFHHFHHFRNRFAFFPFFGGGWDWDYPYADCGYWGSDYCGYGYPDYAYGYGYPDYSYDYGYPATGSSNYYSAAPLVTGRSVATGQLGSYCTISVKTCELQHPSYVGGTCSCRVPGGRARGFVTH